MKWMIDYVKDAPGICLDMIKNRKEVTKNLTKKYLSKKYDGVVIVGSGSSYNIALSSKNVLEKYLGKKIEVITPRSYAYYDYNFNENKLIICISQSGRSTNTIEAVQRAHKMKNDVVAISMFPNSPICNYLDDCYTYGSYNGEGDSFVSKGYPTSFLFFALFAIEIALKEQRIQEDEYKKILSMLEKTTHDMVKMREQIEEFYEKNIKSIHNSKRIMFAGIGTGLSLAHEACLKFSETTGIPTNGYELEEFLHGPSYEVKKDHAVFIYDLDNVSNSLAYSVYESTKLLTNNVFLITDKKLKGETVFSFETDLYDEFKPMLFVIPVQVIPSRICSDLNVRAITIYNYRASKMIKTKTDEWYEK